MASQSVEIEWKGRTGPFLLQLGPGVFSPTATSKTLAEAIEIEPGDTVIDVGCGSGVLAFVAAKLGAAKVYGVDLSQRAVEAARENAKRLGLGERVRVPAGGSAGAGARCLGQRADRRRLGHPDDIAAESGWFVEVPSGGPTGAELPTKFVRSIGETLAHGGRLYLPTGTIQYEKPILGRRARGLRRPHAPGDGARVPAAGPGREVQGRRRGWSRTGS